MKNWVTCLVVLAAALGWTQVLALESSCGVKYVSADHVYLDAGSMAGLVAGQQVRLVRDNQEIALLEVVYTARYSASCKILNQTGEILPGDTAVYTAVEAAEPPATENSGELSSRTRKFPEPQTRPVVAPGPRWKGTVALQWDHDREDGDRNLGNDFLGVPFRVRGTDLWQGSMFRARGTFRHISRTGYSSGTPDSEWRNRIHEVALVRDDRRQDWHFALGRIGTRFTASAGPFDGLSFNYRVATGVRVGAFAGFAPDWGDLDFSTDNTLGGVSFQYDHRSDEGRYLDVKLAGVGRYSGGEVSREYLTLTTSWRDGARLNLLQACEVDINRDWRKLEEESSLELTSLALTGRYALTRRLAVNLGYDDRQPVRTWETRTLPDSLFTDAGRKGLRAGLTWRDSGGRSLSMWGSTRAKEKGDNRTTSWSGSFFWPRFTSAALDFRLSFRGFDGPYLSGWSPTLNVARRTKGGARISAESGYYRYDDTGELADRDNLWLAVAGSIDLSRDWSSHLELRRDWGDDIAGQRLFLELRHRF